MNGGGERKTRRTAKELNLRPFTAQSDAGEGLDMSLPAEELFAAQPEVPDKHRREYEAFVAGIEEEEREEEVVRRPRARVKDVRRADPEERGRAPGRRRPLTEREKLALARQKRFARFISLCIATVVAVAALLLLWFVLIVDHIEVEGNARFTEEQIMESSGLTMGKHIWLSNLAHAKERIEENPYIETAEIKRVYPDKLVIAVTERAEAAVIVGLNTQAVIDPKGYVLSIGVRPDYESLIKIAGMGFGGFHVGQRLGEESDFNSRALVALLAAIYGAGIEGDIELVDVSNPLSVYMTTKSGLTLHIGQPDDLDNKLANYLAVLPKLAGMGMDAAGTLDLSAMGDPVYSPEDEGNAPPIDGSPLPEDGSPPPTDDEPGASPSPTDSAPSPSPSPTDDGGGDGFSG